MKFQPHNMWLHLAKLEADDIREEVTNLNNSNTPAVLKCLREHQPCSSAFIALMTGLPSVSVGAVIGTGVRAKRLRFVLQKVVGERHKVKFYSEVI